MAAYIGPTYREFARLVARYPREELLRIIAAEAVREAHKRAARGPISVPVTPVTLAGVARAALAEGTDKRRRNRHVAGASQLARLCSEYIDVLDPALADGGSTDVEAVLTRIAFEQFGEQYSPMENLSRAHSLFQDYAARNPAMPSAHQWEELLGVDLDTFMRTGFALHVAVMQNGGAISREVMKADHVKAIWEPLSPDDLFAIVDRLFSRTADEHRSLIRVGELPGREKWSFSSLTAYPLVSLGDDLVCPAPHLLIDRVTSTGLWYVAQAEWKSKFTGPLGTTFEGYVGDQWRFVRHAQVLPEISYQLEGSDAKSCDWFIITDSVVLLVEVKCARPSLDYRAGGDEGWADARSRIRDAVVQLERSAQKIIDRHPAFADIPHDRPLRGLIVTLEPYHLRQTLRDACLDSSVLPISHAWAHELENAVARLQDDEEAGSKLLGALSPENGLRGWLTKVHDDQKHPPRNSIVDASWDAWARWPAIDELA
ncbi:hypothetical protein AB0L70_40630 [Kribbella sp. NPDC051952]|uniref:hypothetical protein n=1 Tax=Kribbella sp. NPDC051952 TaxID=3154851 RepID=UPI00342F225B